MRGAHMEVDVSILMATAQIERTVALYTDFSECAIFVFRIFSLVRQMK